MIQRLNAIGASCELHYASRTRGEAAFLRRLRKPRRRSVAAEAHLRSRAGRKDARSSLDRRGSASGCAFLRLRARADARRVRKALSDDVPARRVRISSGSRARGTRRGNERADSKSCWRARQSRSPSRRASRSSTFCSTKESTCRSPAWRASAAPARSACWRAFRTIATSCCTDEEHASNKAMMVCCSARQDRTACYRFMTKRV